jgi:hypothetical protein
MFFAREGADGDVLQLTGWRLALRDADAAKRLFRKALSEIMWTAS